MNTMEDFIGRMTEGDPELRGQVMGIYRGIFENSATDINKKQIAGWPMCSQGIVPNQRLDQDPNPVNRSPEKNAIPMPTDPIVKEHMMNSYASRFGQWKGRIEPGSVTLGMWGGTGPQNVNADTSGGSQ